MAQRLAEGTNTTARERAYIEALAEVYRQDGKSDYEHGQAFEIKMGALQMAYPEDSEAAIFHALTLDIVAPKTDKTFANQRKCVEILTPIFAKQPNHPGVAHYIIHCSDNPVLAEASLPDDPGTVVPVSFKVGHELRFHEHDPKLADLVAQLEDCVEFDNRPAAVVGDDRSGGGIGRAGIDRDERGDDRLVGRRRWGSRSLRRAIPSSRECSRLRSTSSASRDRHSHRCRTNHGRRSS